MKLQLPIEQQCTESICRDNIGTSENVQVLGFYNCGSNVISRTKRSIFKTIFTQIPIVSWWTSDMIIFAGTSQCEFPSLYKKETGFL